MRLNLFSDLNLNPEAIQSVPHGILFWFLVVFTLFQIRAVFKVSGEKTIKARTVSKNEQIYKELAGLLLWGLFIALFLAGFK